MGREFHVRFCEGLGVRFPRATRLLLLARDAGLAQRGLGAIRQVLGRQHQKLRQPNALPRPLEAGINWLGVSLRPRRQPWASRFTCGYAIPDGKVAEMLQRLTEMTTLP